MTFQAGTATDYQDLLDELVAIATAQHVSAAVVNAGGSGYSVGDVLTISGGTATHAATVRVTGESSGVVTTVAIVNGGAYSAAPSNPASTTGGGGTGCTLDLTLSDTGWTAERDTTWTHNTITEKEVILNGEGDGGTDNIYVGIRTYTEANGLDTAYNWLLAGFTGFNAGLSFGNQAGATPATSPTVSGGAYVPLRNASMDYWFFITARRIVGVVKTDDGVDTHYMSFHLGLLDPFQIASEYPYPIYISGCSARYDALWNTSIPDVGGLTEQIGITGRFGPGFTRKANGIWETVANSQTQISPSVDRIAAIDFTIYPIGDNRLPSSGANNDVVRDGNFDWNAIAPNAGVPGAATLALKRSLDSAGDVFPLEQATLIWSSSDGVDRGPVGNLRGVFWVPRDGVLTSEDTITDENDDVYLVFQNGQRTQEYSYMAIKRE